MRGPAVWLIPEQTNVLLGDLRRTATMRGWKIDAAAVMRNHVHVVVGVPGDPDPAAILRDLKAYASRALTAGWARPASGTWWTQSGSRRVLRDEAALLAAIEYVREQHEPLALWINDPIELRGV